MTDQEINEHIWEPDRYWCMACKHSLYQIMDGMLPLPCMAMRMFSAVMERGR